MVDLDQNLRWCPNSSCDSYIKKGSNNFVECLTCKEMACFACGLKAHHGVKCGESIEDAEF